MRLTIKMLLIILPFLVTVNVLAQNTTESETYRVGLMVQAVQGALNLRDEQALKTICLYGTDSLYYSIIKEWLFQELIAVESQLHASNNEKMTNKFQRHSNFLKRAIRSVGLK